MVEVDFEWLVKTYYVPLFRFGRSLSRTRSAALDLTQHTFLMWASKGYTLRDPSKAKSWLFTTLYRKFLADKRRAADFEHVVESLKVLSAPHVLPSVFGAIDTKVVHGALLNLEDRYGTPARLFYVEEHSYQQIAKTLGIPLGTVMSRVSRGRRDIRRRVGDSGEGDNRIREKGSNVIRSAPTQDS